MADGAGAPSVHTQRCRCLHIGRDFAVTSRCRGADLSGSEAEVSPIALFVPIHLRDKTAATVMCHGMQRPELFEALPTAEVQREFQRVLATMRALCSSSREAIYGIICCKTEETCGLAGLLHLPRNS